MADHVGGGRMTDHARTERILMEGRERLHFATFI
jgi:hypothetical protein